MDAKQVKILQLAWCCLIVAALFIVFQTHPLLRFGYDMWHHLDRIDAIATGNIKSNQRIIWYYPWAKVFNLLEITDVIKRAYIIHYTQIIITASCIYISANIILNNLFKINLKKLELYKLKYIAYLSTLIWFLLHATESHNLHHVWIFWYSINYQITLPLYILATALSLHFFNNFKEKKNSVINFILVVAIVVYVLLAHEMEFLYYIISLIILFLCYWNLIRKKFSVKFFLTGVILLILLVYFFTFYYTARVPELFAISEQHNLSIYANKIRQYGDASIAGLNRSSASVNELLILSGVLIFPSIVMVKITSSTMNSRLILLLTCLSVFTIIPLNRYSAGLFSLLTDSTLINRFYYASFIFLSIPIFLILSSQMIFHNINLIFIGSSIVAILVLLAAYSKHVDGNYYKNINSIKNSFVESEMNSGYDVKIISQVERTLFEYDAKYGRDGYHMIARQDHAYLIYFILKRKNIMYDKHHIFTKKELEEYCISAKKIPIQFNFEDMSTLDIYKKNFPSWYN